MSTIWHKIRAYAAGLVTVIACQCHLPITLPLLISLTAGTAFGAWLASNTLFVGVISAVIFMGGLALAIKWFSQPYCPPISATANRRFTYTQTKTKTAIRGVDSPRTRSTE